MPQISKFLRSWVDNKGRTGVTWWCPGCERAHSVPTHGGAHPVWQFDGNLDLPTITPSYREFVPAQPAEDDWPAMPEFTCCHCFVTAGQINFLGDSGNHELRGFVPMTDLDTIKDYGWGHK